MKPLLLSLLCKVFGHKWRYFPGGTWEFLGIDWRTTLAKCERCGITTELTAHASHEFRGSGGL